MPDREKVVKGLEICAIGKCGNECPYNTVNYGCRCKLELDAIALLKEHETHDTREARIFQCKECGYGIEDIFLTNEHDYPINPVYCPNCGRKVKLNA